jgi:hypothetical protein
MTIMTVRDKIAATVDAWAASTHRETYLDGPLHPKARGWLIDHVDTMLRGMGIDTSAPIAPSPAEINAKARKEMASKTASKGLAPAQVPAHAPEPPKAPVSEPEGAIGNTDEVPSMDDLKAKMGKQQGKRKAGK